MPASPRKDIGDSSYLEKHGITGLLDRIMKELMDKKPADPFEYIEAEVKKARDANGNGKVAEEKKEEKAEEKKEEPAAEKKEEPAAEEKKEEPAAEKKEEPAAEEKKEEPAAEEKKEE